MPVNTPKEISPVTYCYDVVKKIDRWGIGLEPTDMLYARTCINEQGLMYMQLHEQMNYCDVNETPIDLRLTAFDQLISGGYVKYCCSLDSRDDLPNDEEGSNDVAHQEG